MRSWDGYMERKDNGGIREGEKGVGGYICPAAWKMGFKEVWGYKGGWRCIEVA